MWERDNFDDNEMHLPFIIKYWRNKYAGRCIHSNIDMLIHAYEDFALDQHAERCKVKKAKCQIEANRTKLHKREAEGREKKCKRRGQWIGKNRRNLLSWG